MTERINKLYKAAELRAAIAALQNNSFHNFSASEARGIVVALHQLGFRVVYAGKVETLENDTYGAVKS